MTEKLLDGRRVQVSGCYDGPARGENAGRKWAMVQEVGRTWWKPAYLDELKEIPMEKTVYLCGPINGCTDEECKDWRSLAKKALAATCDTLDPMRRDYRGREDECVAEIVELDKNDVEASDIILVNYVKPSVGTSMEVLYAWEQEKQVLVVAPAGVSLSPWMLYHSDRVFHTFQEAFSYISGGCRG